MGLGHATRTLPIIKAYLPSHQVHIISSGNALVFLKKELSGTNVIFYECEDYPPLQRGTGFKMYWYLLVDGIRILSVFRRERKFIESLAKKITPYCVISDGRYGSYLKDTPSFIITHQVSFAMPRGLHLFQKITDYFNYRTFRKFDALIIPDYEDPEKNIAGVLSNHPMLSRLKHYYIGILSSLQKQAIPQDVDFLFSVGGFLSDHKPSFLNALVEQAKKLSGKKVFILGKMETKENLQKLSEKYGDIEIISSVAGNHRQELFNQAKIISSRSGYSTIMDLIELGKNGLLIPTPGQTEQEYLATYYKQKKYFSVCSPDNIDLGRIRSEENGLVPFEPPWKTATSVQKISEIVAELARPYFFSIIIPAHNEEKYIKETLESLKKLSYPKDRFEALVIENGSTDKTLEAARAYSGENISVYVSEKGASRAKNFGLEKISSKSDWVIFLDADTHLEESFLRELNQRLQKHRFNNFSIGTTSLKPLENKSLYARLWFSFYNYGHKLTKTSFAIQIMKSSLKNMVKFDETIHFEEDLKLIKDLRRFGRFFYLKTDAVATSTRRFDNVGWFKQFIIWNWQALVLSKTRKKTKDYKVIR